MKKAKKKNPTVDYKSTIKWLVVIITSIITGFGVNFIVRPTEDGGYIIESSFSIELAENQIPGQVINADGEIEETNNIVTVENLDSNQLINECEGEECGLGEYVYAPTETPQAFKDYVINKCWDLDHHFSAQCWDLGELYWLNYTGRDLSTCGTGAAKGTWDCKEYNAGEEFELITDKNSLQPGDWVVFSSGKYGHIGMAVGGYNNGYIALLGENQGGNYCEGGGAAANIINLSLNSFVGAFRPKSYIIPEPSPEPEPIPLSGCKDWWVEYGDTMSKIMLDCEGTIHYGEAMNQYAKSWYSTIIKPNQSVYDGWNSPSGVGLYADDLIEHRMK